MLTGLEAGSGLLLAADWQAWLANGSALVKVIIGFSLIIFVHELGHFLFARWVGVRVDRFAIGFGPRVCGWRHGEGFSWGRGSELSPEAVREHGWGETDYCIKALPLGGYVKMLGEDDILIDDKTGKVTLSTDPRAFPNRPVSRRMMVVSAGVIFNVLFAALAFMVIFLIGHKLPAPVIGMVEPGSPAELAGLLPGDRLLRVNGHESLSFLDLRLAEILSDKVTLRIERDGKVRPDDLVIPTDYSRVLGTRQIGVAPTFTAEVPQDGEAYGGGPAPRAGDVITQVNGEPARDFSVVYLAFAKSAGRPVQLTLERRDPNHPNAPAQQLRCAQRPRLYLDPGGSDEATDPSRPATLLGMIPRTRVGAVLPRTSAQAAGMQRGDVLAEWGEVASPTYTEITAANEANAGHAMRVVVERDGAPVTLHVTAQRRWQLWGRGPAQIGITLPGSLEMERAVVADVAASSPAAALHLPRGAELTAIDGKRVRDWADVVSALFAAAGRTVVVHYRAGGLTGSGRLDVPSSISNELGLPADAVIVSIDGYRSVKVGTQEGALTSSEAIRVLLRKLLTHRTPAAAPAPGDKRAPLTLPGERGRPVDVVWGSRSAPGQLHHGTFYVTPHNTDPWQRRVRFLPTVGAGDVLLERVSAHGNPLLATWMGVKMTLTKMLDVYRTFGEMVRMNVSPENVSGPIGIVQVAVGQAKAGFTDLLFFLAFLSLNLAVINFMPMPVMDGGVMVFLIIEKIRGKPLNLKTQMIFMMIGLAIIAVGFVLVTAQDIMRWVAG